jgi:hypothetical protein
MSLYKLSTVHKNLNSFFKIIYISFEMTMLVLHNEVVTIYVSSFLTSFSYHVIIFFMADKFEIPPYLVIDVW